MSFSSHHHQNASVNASSTTTTFAAAATNTAGSTSHHHHKKTKAETHGAGSVATESGAASQNKQILIALTPATATATSATTGVTGNKTNPTPVPAVSSAASGNIAIQGVMATNNSQQVSSSNNTQSAAPIAGLFNPSNNMGSPIPVNRQLGIGGVGGGPMMNLNSATNNNNINPSNPIFANLTQQQQSNFQIQLAQLQRTNPDAVRVIAQLVQSGADSRMITTAIQTFATSTAGGGAGSSIVNPNTVNLNNSSNINANTGGGGGALQNTLGKFLQGQQMLQQQHIANNQVIAPVSSSSAQTSVAATSITTGQQNSSSPQIQSAQLGAARNPAGVMNANNNNNNALFNAQQQLLLNTNNNNMTQNQPQNQILWNGPLMWVYNDPVTGGIQELQSLVTVKVLTLAMFPASRPELW